MRKILFVVLVALIIATPAIKARGEYHNQSVVNIEQIDRKDPESDDWQLAAQADVSAPLTLEQCIKIALEMSSSMRIADLDLETADLNVSDARADYWPRIDVSGQYRFSDAIDFGFERQNYDAQIAANYVIWDHGRREAGLAQAKANEKAARNDYARTKQGLVFSITEAYYSFLETEKLIDVNEKLLEISRGNVKKVTAFQETGRSIPADVATARVQQASDELALINSQNNFELARARLASLMGLDPRTPIDIQDEPDYELYERIGLTTRDVSLQESVATAIENRPELIGLWARLDSMEWSLRLARLDRWPVVTAEYDYNILLDDYLRDRDNFGDYRNWSAVVRVSFPIFDGGASERHERSADIAVQQMKEDIGERERDVMLEVQEAYLDLGRARKSLEIARAQVKDATESLNVTQGRYEQHMENVIFLDVLQAQARYAQALTNQVRAFYDYKIAGKALEKAMGALKTED